MGIKGYNVKYLGQDILIGVIIALVSIPISMGYSLVAGLPAIYGLYGSLFPIIFFGLLSTSPRFVFGVDAAPAALVGGMLSTMSIASGSEEAIAIIPVITIIVSAWLLIFYFLKADKLLKFISQPVMGGFITGIGVTIISMQIPKLFGGDAGRGEMIELVIHIVKEMKDGFHVLSFVTGIVTIVIILVMKKLAPKVPMQVIIMGISALLSYFLKLEKYGIKMLPEVSGGLPRLSFPDLTLIPSNYENLLLPSLTIAVVIMSETLLATSNIGLKHDDRIEPGKEVLTYAVCNASSALVGCCPVNGSVSRTGIADQFGVKSQVMSITAGLSMLLILLFGTGFIGYLPVPVLTAIVISALIGTFEFELAARLRKVDKAEFFIFYSAFFAVLLLGTIYGVLIGIVLSAATFIVRQSKPTTALLGVSAADDGFHTIKEGGAYDPIQGVVIYRFTGSLFYATIDQFQENLQQAVTSDTRVIVVDASGIGSIDVTAAERLMLIYKKYKEKGIDFYLAGHVSRVNEELKNFGAKELILSGAVRLRISYALKAAGIEKPYEVVKAEEKDVHPDTKKIAELEWAFGENSEEEYEKESIQSIFTH
ncbi:MAG: SulP family inorganic anion transporter [Eubacterium sp.]|nr:SulP family inorganic anion transporter [Eubacterium sp.]